MEENKNEKKFVPAYEKKKEDNSSQIKNKNRLFKSKITFIIIGIIAIAIISTIIFFILKKTNVSYGDYDILMQKYGFESIYSDNSVLPIEKVSKSEAIKMIVAASLNINDISKGYYVSDKDNVEYDNEIWVRYAKSVDMLSENEMTKDNQDDNITYIECIRYISLAKQKILGKKADITTIPNFKDYSGYNVEQQTALADLVNSGIISDSTKKVNGNKKLTKSKFNELIINYVVKYNLITLNDDKINIKEEKKPSNENDYPYTLIGVDKSIYELPFISKNENSRTPIEVFPDLKYSYSKIIKSVTDYLNQILNVDYTNFNQETFMVNMEKYSKAFADYDKLTEYVEYVKNNEIIISGTTKVILPIIYFDGENYRIRIKINYDIKNAKELKNIIFGDSYSDTNIIYSFGDSEVYVDVPFNRGNKSELNYVEPTIPLLDNKVK